MKTTLPILLGILIATSASAEFRTWTRSDGKTAELELLSVTEEAGEKTGEFQMRNGTKVVFKSSVLSENDAKLLAEWKPSPPETPEVKSDATSVFDEVLDGNLEKLDGKSLKSFKDLKKPTKYYVFYYTASWCGPCQKFTPSLVDFYNKNKNDNFEIILITSDQDEKAMEGYAASKNMPWPHLKLRKAAQFKKKFQHGVSGIPSVIVCDLQGKIVTTSGRNLSTLGELLK